MCVIMYWMSKLSPVHIDSWIVFTLLYTKYNLVLLLLVNWSMVTLTLLWCVIGRWMQLSALAPAAVKQNVSQVSTVHSLR